MNSSSDVGARYLIFGMFEIQVMDDEPWCVSSEPEITPPLTMTIAGSSLIAKSCQN